MTAEPAPDRDTIRRFLLGQLPEVEAAAVERHLTANPSALGDLDALPSDNLTAALRDSALLGDLESPEVSQLIEQFSTPLAYGDADTGTDPPAILGPPLEAGDVGQLGGYRVFRVLGRGGMGVVFEAQDPRLGRRVALKVMTPTAARKSGARERFLREARAAAAVDHEHITPIFQVGEDRGVPFLAMPLLLGETLEERFRSGPPLTMADVVVIGRQMTEGLAAAHAAGLIHRDIKPSNVWLERTADGAFRRVRIFDFGLAKSQPAPGGDDPATITWAGTILGTPSYMAPEQARGRAVDGRADLFSLGCVLYEMTTGRRPFQASDAVAVLAAMLTETPAAPQSQNPAVPAALSDLIQRLLAKDPADRPQSAREVADELTRIAAVRPARSRRSPVALAAAAVLLLALGGLAARYGATVIRIIGNKGELVVEVDDPTIEVAVKDGRTTVYDKTRDRTFVLSAGDGSVTFRDPNSGAATVTKTFTVSRGGTTVVRATANEVRGPAATGDIPVPRIRVPKTDGWIAVSPDGKLIAVPLGGEHGEVWLFDTATGEVRLKLTDMDGRAIRSAFTADGRMLVTANVMQKEAIVWDLRTGDALRRLGYGAECLSVAVRPGGKEIAVGGAAGARVYAVDTGKEVRSLAHAGKIHGLAYSPNGELLASASEGKSVRVWNADTGAAVHAVDDLPYRAVGIAFSPDGKLLATGGDRMLRVWDTKSWGEVISRNELPALWVGFAADSRTLWAGPWMVRPGQHSQPWRWDVTTKLATELPVHAITGWLSFALSPDGKTLYVADTINGVWACDPATGRPKVD
jgi:hypothetical protein